MREIEFNEYQDYLLSDHWINLRERIINRDGKCMVCGSTNLLNVHHLTYERMGNENEEDLVVLCQECHDKFHKALAKHEPRYKELNLEYRNAVYSALNDINAEMLERKSDLVADAVWDFVQGRTGNKLMTWISWFSHKFDLSTNTNARVQGNSSALAAKKLSMRRKNNK